MTYRKRVDLNQAEIVKTLRVAGYFVCLTYRQADGFPDLLVVSKADSSRVMLMEVKQVGERLTDDEKIFFSVYPGRVCIAQTGEQAITIMRDFDRETED